MTNQFIESQQEWLKEEIQLSEQDGTLFTDQFIKKVANQIVKNTGEKLMRRAEGEMEVWSAIEHERWSKWQSYLHSKLEYVEYQKDSKTYAGYLMSADDYTRWERQIDTSYAELSEVEKESDREQVRPYIDTLKKHITQLTGVENLLDDNK